jgi:NADPH:quinone reductase-like Zn-dependent oxidoreductase
VPIPHGLSFAEATLIARHFPLAFGEASLAGLKKGDWVLAMGAAGEFRVLIEQVMPLREAASAHRHVAQNISVGKIVLDPTLE